MLKIIFFCSILFSFHLSSQGLNIAHENVFIETGSAIGYSVYNVEDKIYLFANAFDFDGLNVGQCVVYNSEGNYDNTYKFDSPDSLLHAHIGQQDGVFFDSISQEFIFPLTEFTLGQNPKIWKNSIVRMSLNGAAEIYPVPDDPLLDFVFFKVIPSSNDGYFSCGLVLEDSLVTSDPSGAHGFLMELDAQGNTLWMQRYEEAWEIRYFDQNENGEFILGGGFSSFPICIARRTFSH